MKTKRIISIALLIIIMLTTTVLAQDGFSDVQEATSSIISLPDNSVKGSFSDFTVKGNSIRQDVINGDFSDGTTGWSTLLTSSFSVTDEIATFIATAKSGRIQQAINVNSINDVVFRFARVKANSNLVGIGRTVSLEVAHSGSGNYEILGKKTTAVNSPAYMSVIDNRESNWDNIYVDYAGFINMTALGIEDWTEEQMLDLVRQGYWEGTKSTLGGVVKSVGKNLFDINDHIKWLKANGDNVIVGEDNGDIVVTFDNNDYHSDRYETIKFKKNTQYTFSLDIKVSGQTGLLYVYYTDGTYSFFSTTSTTYERKTLTTTANKTVSSFTWTYSLNGYTISIKRFQLEEGTTATTYEEYKHSEAIYTIPFNSGELTRVPNGSADNIDMNTGIATQRNKKHVLQSGDIVTLITSGTNNDYATISKAALIGYIYTSTNTILNGEVYLDGFSSLKGSYADTTEKIGGVYNGTSNLIVAFAKGTYANLAAAQADLAGTEIIYQLATPITEEISIAPLIAYENGTVMFEPIVEDSAIYSTSNGLAISNKSIPIESIESIKKIWVGTDGIVNREDLEPVNVISHIDNRTNIYLNNANEGETYQFVYRYPEELTTIPTVQYSVPIDMTGQISGNTDMIQKNWNLLDKLLKEIDMLWNEIR